jgi:hypothetical protein
MLVRARILLLFAFVFLAGCATNLMSVSPHQELQKPSNNEAQVIFMRSTFVGSAISASLYDVTNGEIKFIGVIVNGTKVAYKTTPGKHVFMVVSEAADFMEADLNGGKNYFSLATPRMGAWKARFSLWPIKNDPSAPYRLDSDEFNDWVGNTKLVSNTDESRAWYESNKGDIKRKYEEYWPVWQSKSAEDQAKLTLMPRDGK